MNISEEKLSAWKSAMQVGDKKKILDLYFKKHRSPAKTTVQGWIGVAFKTGHCNEKLLPVIESFFQVKA